MPIHLTKVLRLGRGPSCAIRIILKTTDRSTKRADWSRDGSSACLLGSGHRHDAAAGRQRGHRDGIGRDRDDAGRHGRLLLRASRRPARPPGVLVWPDIFGLRPAFRQMGKRLAESGYSVLVVNPFYRAKKAPTADSGAATPIPQVMPLAQALNETTHMTDAKAFIAWLDQQASVAQEPEGRHAGLLHGRPDRVSHRGCGARSRRRGRVVPRRRARHRRRRTVRICRRRRRRRSS